MRVRTVFTDRFRVSSESSQADDAAGGLEECEVEVVAYLVADPESFELVEPGEGPLDDPAGSLPARSRARCLYERTSV
jgi:hypothetical protein